MTKKSKKQTLHGYDLHAEVMGAINRYIDFVNTTAPPEVRTDLVRIAVAVTVKHIVNEMVDRVDPKFRASLISLMRPQPVGRRKRRGRR
jgi:hypothetical protein